MIDTSIRTAVLFIGFLSLGSVIFFLLFLLALHFYRRVAKKHWYGKGYINEPLLLRLRGVTKLLLTLSSMTFLLSIFIDNLAPFGISASYSLNDGSGNLSVLGPKNRVRVETNGSEKLFHQTHDLIYFTTK